MPLVYTLTWNVVCGRGSVLLPFPVPIRGFRVLSPRTAGFPFTLPIISPYHQGKEETLVLFWLERVVSVSFMVAGVTLLSGTIPSQAVTVDPGTLPVAEVQKKLVKVGAANVTASGVWDEPTVSAWKWFNGKFVDFPEKTVTGKALRRLDTIAAKVRIPDSCTKGKYVLCADTYLQTIRLYKNGEQVGVADATFGWGKYATRRGVHRVHTKTRFLVSDLSGTPMPYSLFFDGGQAFHYSEAFRKRGYAVGTLGCIAVGDKQFAKQVYAVMNVGARFVVH